MKTIDLENGYFKLVNPKGKIVGLRTGSIYSEVVCKEKEIKWFKEVYQ